jgi:hypothetical protein
MGAIASALSGCELSTEPTLEAQASLDFVALAPSCRALQKALNEAEKTYANAKDEQEDRESEPQQRPAIPRLEESGTNHRTGSANP